MKLARRAPDPDRPSIKQLGPWIAYSLISQQATQGALVAFFVVGVLLNAAAVLVLLFALFFVLDRKFMILPYKPMSQWNEREHHFYEVARGRHGR